MAGQVASGDAGPDAGKVGKFAPLREPTFRRIWTTSLFSNFGQLILGVGAAWEMTRLSDSPQMVALVQTAMMLPLMLVALPAGAVADMFDRRKIALAGLGLSVISASALTAIAFAGLTTPWLLLAFCVLIGAGVALYSPAWQASIGEQVSQDHLPQAIALGTISYNVARSFGPALGGLVVLALGAKAAFGINAVFYVPLWLAFFFWKRTHQPSRLPPERIDRAILSGGRYALHSPPIRTVMLRACIFGIASAAIMALSPLVARDLLKGDADVYGLLLGASGVGAVLAALFVGDFRARYSTEAVVRVCTLLTAICLAVIGLSRSVPLTCAAMFISGGCNILSFAMMNVSVQLSAPRWVTARALSLYSSALTGGFALGAWIWGVVAQGHGVVIAFLGSAAAVAATLLVAWVMPLPKADEEEGNDLVDIGYAPEPALALTMRSGPVVVEVEYDVDPEAARDFYQVMLRMERVRKRIGAFDWSISRDIANPAIWIERYRCATWGDYLRMRDRYTQSDFEVQEEADAFNRSGGGRRVRRRLERPYGSVRWKADSPDLYRGTVDYFAP